MLVVAANMNVSVIRRSFLVLLTITCIYFLYAYRYSSQDSRVSFSVDSDDHGIFKFKLNPITKAYELDGKPIIWQYWHSYEMPLYVRLMTEALRCRNPEFEVIVVHEEDVYRYLPDLQVDPDVFKILYPAHHADIFRLAILLRYGGVFTDVDVYPLDKIYPLYEMLADYDLIIGNWGRDNVAFGGMGPTRANVSLFRIWHANQTEKIRSIFPNGNDKNLTEDPLGWTDILWYVEPGIGEEIDSNRTTWFPYNGPITNNILIDIGLQHSSHLTWYETSPRFLPLNWSPFLFVWGAKMRELFSNMTKIDQLFPENETMYSAFVGCALMDCREEYTIRKKSGNQKTSSGQLDLTEILEALEKVNQSICDSIRKKPIFEIHKYEYQHGYKAWCSWLTDSSGRSVAKCEEKLKSTTTTGRATGK